MRILVKFDENDRIPNMTPSEIAKAAFSLINDAYESVTTDTYLLPPESDITPEEEFMELVDGQVSPEKIRETAETWNRNLENEFTRCLEKLQASVKEDRDGHIPWLNASSTVLYEMKQAAMALDDDMYEFADCAILIDRHRILKTRIEKKDLLQIQANPGNYLLVSVYPK